MGVISFAPCSFFCGSLQQHCVLRKDVMIFIHVQAFNIQCDRWRVSLFAMHADTTPKFSERTKHSLVFRLLNWNNSDIHSLFTKVFFCVCVSPVEDNPLAFELFSNSLRLTCLLRSRPIEDKGSVDNLHIHLDLHWAVSFVFPFCFNCVFLNRVSKTSRKRELRFCGMQCGLILTPVPWTVLRLTRWVIYHLQTSGHHYSILSIVSKQTLFDK